MNNKKRKIIIILGIISFIVILSGGTFAYFQWATNVAQRTGVTFTTEKGFSCSATGGGNITSNEIELVPSMCTNSGYAIKRTIRATTNTSRGTSIYMDLWLDVKNITAGLSNTNNFRYALTTSDQGCNAGNVISTGSFQGTSSNDKIYISNNDEFTSNSTKTYYLYIWLDYTEEEDSTMNQAFHLELNGECRDGSIETPNKPYLYNTGLIPVKLSDNGATVTSVSENDSTWYDYSQKKWANAVLVKESGVKTREENRVPNTVINESDILAYYVWIPRYKYAFPSTCADIENPNENDNPECYGYHLTPEGRERITQEFTQLIMSDYDGLTESQARAEAESQIEEYIAYAGEEPVIQVYEGYGYKWLSDEDKNTFAAAIVASGQFEGVTTTQAALNTYNYLITQGNGTVEQLRMLIDAVHSYNETQTPQITPAFDYSTGFAATSTLTGPRSISIQFEQGIPTKSNGTATGTSYYTHPAFTFGTKELTGIWAGKFETSHETLSSSTTNNNLGCSQSGCTTYNGLRILPNVQSLRYNDISNFFYVSRAMETNGNSFGIIPSTTDTHMMKNSEWGAVAYLSHSKYGINVEVRSNNQSTYTTGCGALNADDSATSTCNNAYKTVTTYPQSTTGNVTGVFDMSGGANEYVMGTYDNDDSYGNSANSGFDSSTNPLPDSKYYDNYDSTQFTGTESTNFTLCTLATCGGHALNETKSWYSDYTGFVFSGYPWFSRGGYYSNGSNAGVFYANLNFGSSYSYFSFRLVLLAG